MNHINLNPKTNLAQKTHVGMNPPLMTQMEFMLMNSKMGVQYSSYFV